MRQIILSLLVLGLAVVIGLFLAHVPALVLLEVGAFSVAVPLWFLVLCLLLVLLLLRVVQRITRQISRVPIKWREQLESLRQQQKMRQQMQEIEKGIQRAKARVK